MTETVELTRSNLKKLLKMYGDATQLLENIPKLQDEGRHSEVSQHIGAELEARINKMSEVETEHPIVQDVLDEIANDEITSADEELQKLEEELLDE